MPVTGTVDHAGGTVHLPQDLDSLDRISKVGVDLKKVLGVPRAAARGPFGANERLQRTRPVRRTMDDRFRVIR